MDKETLEKAKRLEKDIQEMKNAVTWYKRGKWSACGLNNSSLFHFAFCKNYDHRNSNIQELPTWLNKQLMEVVEQQMLRCELELAELGNEQPENNQEGSDDWTPTHAYVEGEKVIFDGIEYRYHKGKFVPIHKRSLLKSILELVFIIVNIFCLCLLIRYRVKYG